MAGSQWVIDVTAESFQKDVLDGSKDRLVLLDFWAPWCAPCRQMAPMLAKLADDLAGKVLIAKVNTDAEQNLAAAFRVESIPWVLAFQNGQPVDQLQGVMAEPQLREWVARLLPSPADELVSAARALEATDPQAAVLKYRAAIELDESASGPQIALSRLFVSVGRLEEARRILNRLAERGFLEPEAQQVEAELEVRTAALDSGGVDVARKAMEANPDDLGLQIQLAEAYAAAGQMTEAFDLCLEIVRRDRSGAGVQAKDVMVKLFSMLGPASELVGEYRRKLATLLY